MNRARACASPRSTAALFATAKMSFIVLKKKRYKFQVDLCLEELSEVSYSRGVMFAKIRQLDGGSFSDVSQRQVLIS